MKIIIDEKKEQEIIGQLLTEVFYPSSEKVKAIVGYLDKNFVKSSVDDVDENGYPKKTMVAVMLGGNKQPVKTMQPRELLLLLDDKYGKIITDNEDRKRFLKQVIKDWFANRISSSGVLSVNKIS